MSARGKGSPGPWELPLGPETPGKGRKKRAKTGTEEWRVPGAGPSTRSQGKRKPAKTEGPRPSVETTSRTAAGRPEPTATKKVPKPSPPADVPPEWKERVLRLERRLGDAEARTRGAEERATSAERAASEWVGSAEQAAEKRATSAEMAADETQKAIRRRLAEVETQIKARLVETERQMQDFPPIAEAVNERIESLEKRITEATSGADELPGRIEETDERARAAEERAAEAERAAEESQKALKRRLAKAEAEIKSRLAGAEGEIKALPPLAEAVNERIESLEKRITEATTGTGELPKRIEDADGRARAAEQHAASARQAAQKSLKTLLARLSKAEKQIEEELPGLIDEANARSRKAEERATRAERVAKEQSAGVEQAAAEWLEGMRTRLAEAEARMQERLARAEAQIKDFPLLAESVNERVDRLEHRVTEAARSAAEPVAPIAIDGGRATKGSDRNGERRRSAPPRRDSHARRRINGLDFEQLRELGLSITQSARLLTRREIQGGFRSLDELESLPEFPPELVKRLKHDLEAA